MATINRIDIVLFVLLASIAISSFVGFRLVANAVYELADRTIMVQCQCR